MEEDIDYEKLYQQYNIKQPKFSQSPGADESDLQHAETPLFFHPNQNVMPSKRSTSNIDNSLLEY